MKILQVIPYFCFGGAETMCENLTYALRDLGHDVVVVSLFDERTKISDRMEAAGVRIRYLSKKPGLDMSVVPKLTKIFREERPDVVHTHLNVILYAVMAARLAGASLRPHGAQCGEGGGGGDCPGHSQPVLLSPGLVCAGGAQPGGSADGDGVLRP